MRLWRYLNLTIAPTAAPGASQVPPLRLLLPREHDLREREPSGVRGEYRGLRQQVLPSCESGTLNYPALQCRLVWSISSVDIEMR